MNWIIYAAVFSALLSITASIIEIRNRVKKQKERKEPPMNYVVVCYDNVDPSTPLVLTMPVSDIYAEEIWNSYTKNGTEKHTFNYMDTYQIEPFEGEIKELAEKQFAFACERV
jgi:hypothetical protein